VTRISELGATSAVTSKHPSDLSEERIASIIRVISKHPLSFKRLWRPVNLWDIEDPTLP
jgi:hypothetical protein